MMLRTVPVPVASWMVAGPVGLLIVIENVLVGAAVVHGRIGTAIVNWVPPAGIDADPDVVV